MVTRLRYWRLRWIPRDRQRCGAYGGTVTTGVRLCGKLRWHTDSHAYDIIGTEVRYQDMVNETVEWPNV